MRLVPLTIVASMSACVWAAVPRTETRIESRLGFEENCGQAPPDIRFILRPSLFITDTGFAFPFDLVHVGFDGGNPAAAVSPSDTIPGVVNALTGTNQAKWITGIPHFREIRFRSVYPSIDAVYTVGESEPRLTLQVAAGADPSVIRFRLTAATAEPVQDGRLLLRVAPRRIYFLQQPVASQDAAPVPVQWLIPAADRVQFRVGEYNPSRPLAIEVPIPAFPSHTRTDLHVDGQGRVITAGNVSALGTERVSLEPASEPSKGVCRYLVGPVPCSDAFAAKYDATGKLQFITYMAGATSDFGLSVRADPDGNVWLAGSTDSVDFPVTPDAIQARFAGPPARLSGSSPTGDLFVIKLSSEAGLPLYSSYLGSPMDDELVQLLVDVNASVHIVGRGYEGLPVTPGAFRANTCALCSFAAKFGTDGRLAYLTYLPSYVQASDVDLNGALYFGGGASADFPVTPGAYDTSYNGGPRDAYIARLNRSGTALNFATFFGGPGLDYIDHLAVDSQGNVWFNGPAFPESDNPGTLGGWQVPYFLAKLDASGSRLLVRRSGLGGDLAVDPRDNLYLSTSQSYGQTSVANPGGTLTTSCSQTYLAKFDSQGVLQYAEAGIGPLLRFAPDNKVLTAGTAGVVTLDLSTAPRAWLSCTLSAAGLQGPGEVAPGEILALVGAGLGPPAGAAFTLVNGAVPRELEGTRVLFDGQPAPVLYAQNGQVNAIAPYSLIPGTTVSLAVEYNGMRLGTPLTVTHARPRIFTLDGSGSGYTAALNQDGSINSPQNPAQPGSVISLFLTGTGLTATPLREGDVAATVGGAPLANFRFLLPAGVFLETQYAGLAPGLINSVTQVNLRLPASVAPVYTFTPLSMPVYIESDVQTIYQNTRIAIR